MGKRALDWRDWVLGIVAASIPVSIGWQREAIVELKVEVAQLRLAVFHTVAAAPKPNPSENSPINASIGLPIPNILPEPRQ